MLPFDFKFSTKSQTIHFFPKSDKFPFYTVVQSEPEHRNIEIGVQLTFKKLLNIQRNMKRRNMNEANLEKLLTEINKFMEGTNAVWVKSQETQNDHDFIVFRLVNRHIYTNRNSNPTLRMRVNLEKSRETQINLSKSEEKSPFFRPWN